MKEFIIKYYIQLIIMALLFGSVIFAVFESTQVFGMIKEKSIELKKTQLDQVIAAEFLQNVHIFKNDAEYIDDHIATLDVILPNNDDEKVRLFSELERIAGESGHERVSLAVNVPDPKKKKKTTESEESVLSISVSLIGSYNDLLQFINKVENMQYLANISSFDISKTSGENLRDEEVDNARRDLLKTDMVVNFYLDVDDNKE